MSAKLKQTMIALLSIILIIGFTNGCGKNDNPADAGGDNGVIPSPWFGAWEVWADVIDEGEFNIFDDPSNFSFNQDGSWTFESIDESSNGTTTWEQRPDGTITLTVTTTESTDPEDINTVTEVTIEHYQAGRYMFMEWDDEDTHIARLLTKEIPGEVVITGLVHAGGEPVGGVAIECSHPESGSVWTDATSAHDVTGFFYGSDDEAGSWVVDALHGNYEDWYINLDVNLGEVMFLDVELTPSDEGDNMGHLRIACVDENFNELGGVFIQSDDGASGTSLDNGGLNLDVQPGTRTLTATLIEHETQIHIEEVEAGGYYHIEFQMIPSGSGQDIIPEPWFGTWKQWANIVEWDEISIADEPSTFILLQDGSWSTTDGESSSSGTSTWEEVGDVYHLTTMVVQSTDPEEIDDIFVFTIQHYQAGDYMFMEWDDVDEGYSARLMTRNNPSQVVIVGLVHANGELLGGVTIESTHPASNSSWSVGSDDRGVTGFFYGSDDEAGVWEVLATHDAYEDWNTDINANLGDVKFLEIRMSPLGGSGEGTVFGLVTESQNMLPVEGATISSDLGDITTTDAGGVYSFDVSAGSRIITVTKEGYYLNGRAIELEPDEEYELNVVISPELGGDGQFRFVLSWGAEPEDLDSYLRTPNINGQTHRIYYGNRGSEELPPFAALDDDDDDGFGPETITIFLLYPGDYEYWIRNVSDERALAGCEAVVNIYDNIGLVESVTIPNSGAGRYWRVCRLDGVSGLLQIINEIQLNEP